MKKNSMFFLLCSFVIFPILGFSQVSITSASGMRVDSLLTNYFVGDGVTISNARFNGQAIVNSNQLGIFTNQSTSFPNMPIEEGIVIVTGDFNDAASGNHNNTESSVSVPNSDGNNVSIALSDLLNSNGSSQSMHDVGCISFDFKSHGSVVSFKYSFASEEYLLYVNSSFNDIFAFFISGPYDENDNLITSDSSYYYQYNIAKIPGTQYPVCINNVNHITYPEYFRLNENNNCKMNGYTVELETEAINIIPNGRYKMELAISDIGDSGYNSAVYLTANSFSFSTDLTDTICQGETYTMNGFSATEAGVYTLNLETVDGFDSIVTLNLVVNPTYNTLIFDTICQWDSYLQNGFVFDSMPAGNYFDSLFLNTIYGCDSIVKLNLTVTPTYDTLIIDTICQGYDYTYYNFNIINPTAGVHNKIQNLSTINGCDSIIRLELTVNPSFDTLIIDTICQWDSYLQNGFVLDSMPAGFYQDTLYLNTINGCDSIIKLNLIVGQLYDTTIVDYICEGETYNLNNFYLDSLQVGNYFDTLFLNSIYGCDSIVKLNLTVNPTYDTIISAVICEGESYTENGFSFINKPAGAYNDILSLNTIHGCDSIVRLNLTVTPTYDITISESICEGESYKDNGFVFENMTAGTYNDIQLLSSVNGCDSIVRLELTVNPNYEITISESICEGEDYTENGFSFINKPAGSYQDYVILNSSNGCDSIVKLQLTINKTYRYDIYDSICEGEDYNLYGLNLINPSAGLFEHISNLHTVNGCDSVYNINLKVINKYDDIVIEGLENISVATNLATGCYRYTVGNVGRHEYYTWEIDNQDWKIIPDNNECIVCATTPEKGTLYVRAENSCGSVSDYIVLNAEFIEDQDNANVRIYPNPITDIVNIQQSDISRINVYDSYGQLVLRNDYNFDSHVTLDLSSLKNSVYIIEIITLEKTFVERINIIK